MNTRQQYRSLGTTLLTSLRMCPQRRWQEGMVERKKALFDLRLRHCRNDLNRHLVKGGPDLSTLTIARLAEHLLEDNRHLSEFEVELGDETTCAAVAAELETRGCGVTREPFKFLLVVRPKVQRVSKSA